MKKVTAAMLGFYLLTTALSIQEAKAESVGFFANIGNCRSTPDFMNYITDNLTNNKFEKNYKIQAGISQLVKFTLSDNNLEGVLTFDNGMLSQFTFITQLSANKLYYSIDLSNSLGGPACKIWITFFEPPIKPQEKKLNSEILQQVSNSDVCNAALSASLANTNSVSKIVKEAKRRNLSFDDCWFEILSSEQLETNPMGENDSLKKEIDEIKVKTESELNNLKSEQKSNQDKYNKEIVKIKNLEKLRAIKENIYSATQVSVDLKSIFDIALTDYRDNFKNRFSNLQYKYELSKSITDPNQSKSFYSSIEEEIKSIEPILESEPNIFQYIRTSYEKKYDSIVISINELKNLMASEDLKSDELSYKDVIALLAQIIDLKASLELTKVNNANQIKETNQMFKNNIQKIKIDLENLKPKVPSSN